MKKFILAILLTTNTAHAGTADCAIISDHDTRMTCFASQTGNSSYCSFIKNEDKRIQCRILTGK